jgi:hypothetical protein
MPGPTSGLQRGCGTALALFAATTGRAESASTPANQQEVCFMSQVNVNPGGDGNGGGSGVNAVAVVAIVILVILAVLAVYFLFLGDDGDADADVDIDVGSPTTHLSRSYHV